MWISKKHLKKTKYSKKNCFSDVKIYIGNFVKYYLNLAYQMHNSTSFLNLSLFLCLHACFKSYRKDSKSLPITLYFGGSIKKANRPLTGLEAISYYSCLLIIYSLLCVEFNGHSESVIHFSLACLKKSYMDFKETFKKKKYSKKKLFF